MVGSKAEVDHQTKLCFSILTETKQQRRGLLPGRSEDESLGSWPETR